MTSPVGAAVEPLFAHNVRLWLRVWAAVQSVGLIVGCAIMITDKAPVRPLAFGVVALLVLYHALGFWAHAWILARPWAILLYVPLGWLLVLTS